MGTQATLVPAWPAGLPGKCVTYFSTRQLKMLFQLWNSYSAWLLWGSWQKQHTEDTWAPTDKTAVKGQKIHNYSQRSRTTEEQVKATEQMLNTKPRRCASMAQSESLRNFNFTTDKPKGKFKEVLLWNQNTVHNKLVNRRLLLSREILKATKSVVAKLGHWG